MKKQPVAAFRIIINENELSDTLNDLLILKASNKSSPHTNAFIVKLQMLAIKNNMGAVTPAYVQTGRTGHSQADLYTALNANPIKPTVIIDRRNQGFDRANYTAEQLSDAEFESANHLALTGIKLPIEHFLPKPVVIEERRTSEIEKNHHLESDDVLAAGLFGEQK